MSAYNDRFPTVDILDEHGMETGLRGQVFAEQIDDDNLPTGKVAIMLTVGGPGLKYVPKRQCRIVSGKNKSDRL